MEDKIDQAIGKCLEMVKANSQSDQALKFSQAALNLAHVKVQLECVIKGKTKGAGS